MTDVNKKNDRLMLITLVFLTINLRGTFCGVGSLVPLIREDLGLNNAVAGMITSLPLLIFVVISSQAAGISRRLGLGKTITISIIFLSVGLILRSTFGVFGLFSGTALLSVGIGLGNVLTLSLIKLRFPNRIGSVTGIYSLAMSGSAALSIGISVPVATQLGIGWQGALGMWLTITLASLILWLNRVRTEPKLNAQDTGTERNKAYDKIVYKIPAAWAYAVFYGMQILIFYGMTAWLPSMMQTKGYSLEAAAGFALLFQLVNLPITFIVPILCTRRKNQAGLVIFFGALMFIGFLMLIFTDTLIMDILALIIASLGLGAPLGFSNVFVSLRVAKAEQSAALLGMGQTIGFLIAALAPTLIGLMYDLTGSWTLPLVLVIVCSAIWVISGMPLSRERNIFEGYEE